MYAIVGQSQRVPASLRWVNWLDSNAISERALLPEWWALGPEQGKSQVVIVSIAVGGSMPFAGISFENKLEYAERHGYHFLYVTSAIDTSRHLFWDRYAGMLALFRAGYRFVVYMDLDTLIVRPDATIESIMRRRGEENGEGVDGIPLYYDVAVQQHVKGNEDQINAGIIVMRDSKFSRDLLDAIYSFGGTTRDALLSLRSLFLRGAGDGEALDSALYGNPAMTAAERAERVWVPAHPTTICGCDEASVSLQMLGTGHNFREWEQYCRATPGGRRMCAFAVHFAGHSSGRPLDMMMEYWRSARELE